MASSQHCDPFTSWFLCDLWKSHEIEGLEGHRHLNAAECIAPKAGLALKHLICYSLPVANPLTGGPAGPSLACVPLLHGLHSGLEEERAPHAS